MINWHTSVTISCWSTQSSHFHDCVVLIASSKPINANSKSTLKCYGVWRSKSFRIPLYTSSIKLKVLLETLKVFLNRSSVYMFHTMSHQPLLFLGKCRRDRRWTVSVAIFWLCENKKSLVKDNRRIIRLLRSATYICKLSENILLRWLPPGNSFYQSYSFVHVHYIRPSPFALSVFKIHIRFDTQYAVWISCHANVAPKLNLIQLDLAHEWSGVWTRP